MTDDLENLKALMEAATPAPDVNRRAENLAMAQENFIRAQGLRSDKRPTVKRGPIVRFTEGAKSMLNILSHRGVLTATTAIAAVALVMIVPQTRDFVVDSTSWVSGQTSAESDGPVLSLSIPDTTERLLGGRYGTRRHRRGSKHRSFCQYRYQSSEDHNRGTGFNLFN